MGDGRHHQKYEDAPLFRTVITAVYTPDPTSRYPLYRDGGTVITIKGPFNTPGPAWAAHGKALREHEEYPREGVASVTARVDIGMPVWGELTR